MVTTIRAWIEANQVLLGWLAGVSGVLLVGTLVVVPWLVIALPRDYFLYPEPPPGSWRRRHRAIRYSVLAAKNLAGAVLLLAGLAMVLLPGQGLLTMLVGLILLDWPGKRRVELRLVKVRGIQRVLNRIRTLAGREPLELPP